MTTPQEWMAALGVVAILLGGIVVNHLQVARSLRAPRAPEPKGPAAMVGRFASHEGSVVGQVVALAGDRVVLRHGSVHKAVPLAQARLRDGDVVLEGPVDWAAAEAAGAAWREAGASVDPVEPGSAQRPSGTA